MPDFPNPNAVPVTIWTQSKYGVGVGTRGIAAGSAAPASTAWGTANLAIAVPIWLPFPYPVQNLFVYNFATVAGNVDVGIYNFELSLVASSGSTAQSGATALQFFAKDVLLVPGQYYFAMAASSTTATYGCAALGSATRERYMGLLQMASALPLPAVFTPAAIGQARIPLIGVTNRSGTPTF